MTSALRDQRVMALKAASDVTLPRLKYWNYDPCPQHAVESDEPKVDCEYRACGGDLFSHQRVGVMWAYVRQKGLLADLPGLGKTNVVLSLAALLKERLELSNRMIVVCQSAAVLQWYEEAARWTPKLHVIASYGGLTKQKRVKQYVGNWDVLVIGYHMLLRDWEMLENFNVDTYAIDDVDPLLNHDTQTHDRLVRLTQDATRVIVMNATSIQTKMQQIHAALMPAGGLDAFGPLSQFERRYIRTETVAEYGTDGRIYKRQEEVGLRNGNELKSKLAPLVLRRTYDDLTDIKIPLMMPPENVWLDLHPEQAKRYKELQNGIITLKREEGTTIKHAAALAKVTYGQQICSGLPALGEEDTPLGSSKLDWLMHQIMGPWADRKVLCFIKNIGLVKATQERLWKQNIGYATIWGQDNNARRRGEEVSRFWKDPNCKVFLGTSAIERSLNLQCANILVNVDTLLNPARMHQIAGRVRRAGSKHEHVFVFNLFCRDTQEERYLDVLRRRQALADFTWDEQSELYEKLSPIELLSLISP